MKTKSVFVLLAVASVQAGSLSRVFAQTNPKTNQPPAANQELTKQFTESFLKGCMTSKSVAVKNQAGYCKCLADAYQTRYSGEALTAISQLAGAAGQNGVRLVNLMMTPEATTCTSRNR